MKTKQQLKAEALEEYIKIIDSAWDEYWKITDSAWEEYLKKLKEIDQREQQ